MENLNTAETDRNTEDTVTADADTGTSRTVATDTATVDTIKFDAEAGPPHSAGRYEVGDLRNNEATSDGDWMSRLLLSKEFQLLPANNLQAIFSRLEPIEYSAGAHVIQQDQTGEFFYVITRGHCIVTRKLPTGNGSITLAQLTVGDTFGEEALITNATRQATITMLTDGSVMRLSKTDFKELLSGPIVSFVEPEEAEAIVSDGGMWLDVSMGATDQIDESSDTIKIPMYMLRLKIDVLNPAITYIVTSTQATHGCAAAHILSQYGFQTRVLASESVE